MVQSDSCCYIYTANICTVGFHYCARVCITSLCKHLLFSSLLSTGKSLILLQIQLTVNLDLLYSYQCYFHYSCPPLSASHCSLESTQNPPDVSEEVEHVSVYLVYETTVCNCKQSGLQHVLRFKPFSEIKIRGCNERFLLATNGR